MRIPTSRGHHAASLLIDTGWCCCGEPRDLEANKQWEIGTANAHVARRNSGFTHYRRCTHRQLGQDSLPDFAFQRRSPQIREDDTLILHALDDLFLRMISETRAKLLASGD